jgi:hypothetical protein
VIPPVVRSHHPVQGLTTTALKVDDQSNRLARLIEEEDVGVADRASAPRVQSQLAPYAVAGLEVGGSGGVQAYEAPER